VARVENDSDSRLAGMSVINLKTQKRNLPQIQPHTGKLEKQDEYLKNDKKQSQQINPKPSDMEFTLLTGAWIRPASILPFAA
jgi:hypothetical protein